MNSTISLKKLKANAKLEKLIMEGAPYEKIVKQSRILDKYIAKQMLQINKIRS